MMISKKWWVFLLVGMIFGLGIIYLRGLSSSKVIKETETEVSDQKTVDCGVARFKDLTIDGKTYENLAGKGTLIFQ
jgi:hypothetical protein